MNWYVIYTQPRKESVAAQNLINQGFNVYLPCYRKRCSHARRIYTSNTPLFPGYLFIRMDPATQRWRSINGTIGVCYLLTEGPDPIALPDGVVEMIRAQEEDGFVKIAAPSFEKGQRICVTEGPLADLEGVFDCVDDNQRVVLLLNLMGRMVRACLPGHAVTAS